jgi:hypothetical protein
LISFDALKAIAHGLGVIEGDLVKAQSDESLSCKA